MVTVIVVFLLVALENLRVGLVPLGAGEPKLEAETAGGVDPAVGHVVSVPDPRDDLAIPAAEGLANGEQVGHDLAGMQQIGQPVDHRNGAVAGQLLHVGMIVGPDHDAVEIAGQHPGGVADRLAPAELDVARGEEKRVPAELVVPTSNDTRVRVELLAKIIPSVLPSEWLVAIVPALHPGRQIEDGEQLGLAEVGNRQEVTAGTHNKSPEGVCPGRHPERSEGSLGGLGQGL